MTDVVTRRTGIITLRLVTTLFSGGEICMCVNTNRRATQSKVSNPIFYRGAMRAARLSRFVACVMVQGKKKDAPGNIALPDAHEYAK